MAHTKSPLTYEREASGENWHVATVEFGLFSAETFYITTDHVHASEVSYGEPEDDVRLWCAARDLLAASEAQTALIRDLLEIIGPTERRALMRQQLLRVSEQAFAAHQKARGES